MLIKLTEFDSWTKDGYYVWQCVDEDGSDITVRHLPGPDHMMVLSMRDHLYTNRWIFLHGAWLVLDPNGATHIGGAWYSPADDSDTADCNDVVETCRLMDELRWSGIQ